jgi:hypothetical protein
VDSLITGLTEGVFSLTVTDSNGCIIGSEGAIDFVADVGVEENSVWRAFPNPVTEGEIAVSSPYPAPLPAALLGLQGNIIRELTLYPGLQTLDVSGLPAGVVVLRTIGGPLSLSLRICIGE